MDDPAGVSGLLRDLPPRMADPGLSRQGFRGICGNVVGAVVPLLSTGLPKTPVGHAKMSGDHASG